MGKIRALITRASLDDLDLWLTTQMLLNMTEGFSNTKGIKGNHKNPRSKDAI
jgi:hypothetical protein